MTTHQEIATQLLERFPKAGNLQLARIAYRENKTLFRDLEAARGCFRRIRGASGQRNRTQATIKKFHRPTCKPCDPFAMLPEGRTHFSEWHAEEIEVPARCLVLADLHIPYHDRAALLTALEYGKKRDADMILLNGDIADFFSVSFWEKDPRKRNFADEIGTVKDFLLTLQQGFPKARIIYKVGNHEERLERYMSVKAPELLGISEFELHNILGLKKLGIPVIGDKRPMRLGKLNIIHGHEYKFGIASPVNPARGYFLRAKTHCLGSHLHQSSQHSEKDLEEKVISTWSTGCLCDLHPDYQPMNGWNHGFAFVEVSKSGDFHVDNLKIIDGKVY